MMRGFAPLLEAVQRNCDIADARHARDMTLCSYLLEMREFYRWEQALPAHAVPPRDEVGRWISEREARWEALQDQSFGALPVGGRDWEPFAVAELNAALLPEGLVYGAGIGRFRKPHFFLGRLARRERRDGLDVLVVGCEYARDLTAIPAALQGDTVIVRQEALAQWLREKAEAWAARRADGALARALAAYGYGDDPAAALQRMAAAETETLLLHEQGEHAAGRLLGPAWEEMLMASTSRRAELVARAVRDNWADCLVTLPALVEREAWGSLHFWFANFDGLRRALGPELVAAYRRWHDGDRTAMASAIAASRDRWAAAGRRLLDVFREGGDVAAVADALVADADCRAGKS